jgi:hypothetical protein
MAQSAYSRVYMFLLKRWWVAFVLLGISFVLGGLLTLNLLHTLSANFEFLSMYGVAAVRDGGLWQLVEIAVSGYFAAACYVIFKLCEKVLVERLIMNSKGSDS